MGGGGGGGRRTASKEAVIYQAEHERTKRTALPRFRRRRAWPTGGKAVNSFHFTFTSRRETDGGNNFPNFNWALRLPGSTQRKWVTLKPSAERKGHIDILASSFSASFGLRARRHQF